MVSAVVEREALEWSHHTHSPSSPANASMVPTLQDINSSTVLTASALTMPKALPVVGADGENAEVVQFKVGIALVLTLFMGLWQVS